MKSGMPANSKNTVKRILARVKKRRSAWSVRRAQTAKVK